MDTMIDADRVTLPDACIEEMDLIGVGRILDIVPHGPHFDFDLFGVFVIDTDDVTLYDACTDEMDMIGTGHILDAASHGLIDDDDSVTIVTPDVITIEGASDYVDPPLSFDTMSGFVTRFDDMAGGNNNDMSDGKVRVCVDFRDLNKASPKDDFPFPHIDMLIDSTAGHLMLSFMDEFSGYNKILMALEDMEKTSFITEWGTYYYRCTFKKIKECLLSSPVLVLPTPRCPLLLYLSVLDIAMGCMLAQLDDSGKELVITTQKYPFRYLFDKLVLTGRLIRWLVLLIEEHCWDHLASLLVYDDALTMISDERFVSVTSIAGWRLYFDSAANQSGFGIDILLISPQGDHIPRSIRLAFSDHHRLTNIVIEYKACITGLDTALNLGVRQLEIHGIPTWLFSRLSDVQPLLIETKFALAYCCLIRDIEDQDGLPWYHDIYQFLSCGAYPKSATVKDRRALRQLATRFVICGKSLYRQSPDGLLWLCLDRASTDRVMREVHAEFVAHTWEDTCWPKRL
ncbi:hypothetical protein AAG906_008175 [Vitis piasezkii]